MSEYAEYMSRYLAVTPDFVSTIKQRFVLASLNHDISSIYLSIGIHVVTRIKNIVFFIPALALLFVLQACVIAPAALPRVDEISPSEPLGYDGIWMISGINKRLQFDSGRAVVLDLSLIHI